MNKNVGCESIKDRERKRKRVTPDGETALGPHLV